MQTTLLGLGIAVILALVTALVGPHFVDWNAYRSQIEAQATDLVGMPVRVHGDISARLLPVPSVTLHGVEIPGAGDEAASAKGENGAKAETIDVELALGPLLRGQWHASEIRIVGPQISIAMGAGGRLAWPVPDVGIDLDAVTVDSLRIERGSVALLDKASGARLTLDDIAFAGDLRSLAGPLKGEGTLVIDGANRNFHLATGKAGDDGLRLRFGLDPAADALAFETDGALRFDNGSPRYEGSVTLSRPAGVVLVHGRAKANETWRVASRVKATATSARLDDLKLSYGPDERVLKLDGSAEWTFGAHPKLQAALSARTLDLDRYLALPAETRRLPVAALQAAADALDAPLHPGLPIRIGLGVDRLTLAGGTVQDLHGDFVTAADGWTIETLNLRAPGVTQVRASGQLLLAAPAKTADSSFSGVSFSGPAIVESADPRLLIAWFEGRSEPRPAPLGALRASGQVTLAPERIAIEGLTAALGPQSVAGRLALVRDAHLATPRIEAELKAQQLDLDAAAAILHAALQPSALDWPSEGSLALDVDHATIFGIEADKVGARLRLDAGGLAVERLAVGDFAGTALDLRGRVEAPWTAPARQPDARCRRRPARRPRHTIRPLCPAGGRSAASPGAAHHAGQAAPRVGARPRGEAGRRPASGGRRDAAGRRHRRSGTCIADGRRARRCCGVAQSRPACRRPSAGRECKHPDPLPRSRSGLRGRCGGRHAVADRRRPCRRPAFRRQTGGAGA